MGALRAAVEEAAHNTGPECGVVGIRKRLTPADLTDFDQLIRDESARATIIAGQLKALFDIEVGPEALRRHRRSVTGRAGGCKCRA